MEESSLSHFQGNLIQIRKRIFSASGNSIIVHSETDGERMEEIPIFTKSSIRFLVPIVCKGNTKDYFLAISSKRIALCLCQRKWTRPLTIFKVDEVHGEIIDHCKVKVLEIDVSKNGQGLVESSVKLIIPLVFRSGRVQIMRLTAKFVDDEVFSKNLTCIDETIKKGKQLKHCVFLGKGSFFCFYGDTVVKSDGTVTQAGEPSSKKKRQIAVVGRELWNGNILLATMNGTVRVVRVDGVKKSDSLTTVSEGQCVPPYCTLRCRQPSVIISTEDTVFVGTQRGEIHCLNEKLELIRKIETGGGPITCLKVDEKDANFLWVGYESGELIRKNWMVCDQNALEEEEEEVMNDIEQMEVDEEPLENEAQSLRKKKMSSVSKRSETDLVCLEKGCHFKTRVTGTFTNHLRNVHRTSLAFAGLVLRCQCGVDSISDGHSRKCPTSNFTVFRKNDFGPIRTLADKMTPQCTLCKMFPMTVYGYARHLWDAHDKKRLEEIGCYLKCGVCGVVASKLRECEHHSKKCKSRFYSLVKIEGETKKNDETEMDQTADA